MFFMFEEVLPIDKERIAKLVKEAKGTERNMATFAADSGISAPTLSRIVSGKITRPLSIETIKKIYDAKSKAADLSVEDLLSANGYNSKSNETGFSNRTMMCLNFIADAQGVKKIKNIILNALLDRGQTIKGLSKEDDSWSQRSPYGISLQYDFGLSTDDEVYDKWYFVIIDGKEPLQQKVVPAFFHRVSPIIALDSWEPEFFAKTKISFVFSNREAYSAFCEAYSHTPIKVLLSAILIDEKDEKIIEELNISGESKNEKTLE